MIEHKTISLADQVFDHLEQDILSGVYQRGEALTETKLSAELGVSRTPIREALRRLEQEGIIEETAKGCIVVGISEQDLTDLFLIRSKLEGLSASTAAANVSIVPQA
ncbi:MAG: GntR family transcriptional regulator [Clostridia bacterium]|nr:GntR family transcriptional regulator [Clostridia bacterium]